MVIVGDQMTQNYRKTKILRELRDIVDIAQDFELQKIMINNDMKQNSKKRMFDRLTDIRKLHFTFFTNRDFKQNDGEYIRDLHGRCI